MTRVEIDKPQRVLRAFDRDGTLLAVFPASIGSADKPAPSGTYKVTAVSHDPSYRYDPKYQFKGVAATQPFTIKSGPNNPVGVVWIALSAKGYGIHGTPEPSKVSKTTSHGCIRLTNWDAKKLAAMVDREPWSPSTTEVRAVGALAGVRRATARVGARVERPPFAWTQGFIHLRATDRRHSTNVVFIVSTREEPFDANAV